MSTLFPRTISVKHRSGSLQRGVWVEGEPTLGTFTGSVQPASGKDIEFLPEGRRDVGSVKVYSNEQLLVSTEGGSTPGDVVVWQGKQWEVVTELAYQNEIISHYKYLASYIGEEA